MDLTFRQYWNMDSMNANSLIAYSNAMEACLEAIEEDMIYYKLQSDMLLCLNQILIR